MTKSLINTLNLPSLEDIIDTSSSDENNFIENIEKISDQLSIIDGKDHSDAMDAIHNTAIKTSEELSDLGFNMEIGRARGIFEQSANFMKLAMEAKISKRDNELKLMKLKLEKEKFEFLKKQTNGETNNDSLIDVPFIVEDRNELIRKHLEEKNKS